MISSEYDNPNGIEGDPSVRIVRWVIDLTSDFEARFEEELGVYGIRRTDVQLYLALDCDVTLIAANEVINLHDAVGRKPTEQAMDELAEYLATELPSDCDGEIRFMDLYREQVDASVQSLLELLESPIPGASDRQLSAAREFASMRIASGVGWPFE
jgi:hypothetical protein